MDLKRLLQQWNRNKDRLSDADRVVLYNMVALIDNDEAQRVYADIVHMYVQMSHEEPVEPERLRFFDSSFSISFLRSLVDIGTLIDKLSDACILDRTERSDKWSQERKCWESVVKHHEKEAAFSAKWSEFLVNSRALNRDAFERTKCSIATPHMDWERILCCDETELVQMPPLFFNNLQVAHLSLDVKRSLVHRFEQIVHVHPKVVRRLLQDLCADIYMSDVVSPPPVLPSSTHAPKVIHVRVVDGNSYRCCLFM